MSEKLRCAPLREESCTDVGSAKSANFIWKISALKKMGLFTRQISSVQNERIAAHHFFKEKKWAMRVICQTKTVLQVYDDPTWQHFFGGALYASESEFMLVSTA